jgi:2-polyprenyl-3-methyl-5-hydroxy-6-metoxy-1,4-benzoquinol methylase
MTTTNSIAASSLTTWARGKPIAHHDLIALLHDIAEKYPSEIAGLQHQDVPRIAFNIELVLSRRGSHCRICDLGGGIGLFSIGCAAIGMEATLVDDFRDSIADDLQERTLNLHRSYGVTVMSRDLIRNDIDLHPESIDAVTSFESMEHWHHSPKRLFGAVSRALIPGGLFVLATPNCFNLRKRLTTPLGIGGWSRMEDWYEAPVFRGHVREPSVADLKYIARDMQLADTNILGRNWTGRNSRLWVTRTLAPVLDHALRFFPSLCSDIYLIGTKPSDGHPDLRS